MFECKNNLIHGQYPQCNIFSRREDMFLDSLNTLIHLI